MIQSMRNWYSQGHFDDVTVVGEPLVLLNIMSERERDQLKNPGECSEEGYLDDPTFLSDQTYLDAVDELYDLSRQQLDGQSELFGCPMALSAGSASATGYVTLAFQGDQDCMPLPVSVKAIRISCPLYRGELKVIESDNVFDERLTLRHSGDFAGEPEERIFEWQWTDALDEPCSPASGRPQDNWAVYVDPSNGQGVIDITVGGAGLLAVQDLWFACRYKGYDTCGAGTWSEWTKPQLHESWVKRVMRSINLFDQRVSVFHESEVNTLVSVISQLGERYEGDVALNDDPDNLNNVGLIELYETLLRRAKDFSIEGTPAQNDEVANRTLQYASSRLADLYMLLGNEAYADAQDPTIGFGTGSSEYSIAAPSIFCFQNQVDSLLSEELALLRGTDDVHVNPLYNRMIWNFTSGEGELAYALSYGITDMAGDPDNPDEPDGIIDESDARVMYPQGHGDAWGHYLMAIKKYYDLLMDNEFDLEPHK